MAERQEYSPVSNIIVLKAKRAIVIINHPAFEAHYAKLMFFVRPFATLTENLNLKGLLV